MSPTFRRAKKKAPIPKKKKPAAQTVSRRELARLLDRDPKTIRTGITKGQIPVESDGKIDPAKARAARAASLSTHQGGRRVRARQSDEAPAPVGSAASFADARAAKERYLAALRGLEYKRQVGDLVERKVVDADWFDAGREIKDSVMAIPDRLAEQIAAELGVDAGPVYELLVRECRTAVSHLADRFQGRSAG
jgi:hypothetical protein